MSCMLRVQWGSLVCRLLSSLCVLTRQKNSKRILWSPLYKGTNSIHKVPPSWRNNLPKAPPPDTITLGVRISVDELGSGREHKHLVHYTQCTIQIPLQCTRVWWHERSLGTTGLFFHVFSISPTAVFHKSSRPENWSVHCSLKYFWLEDFSLIPLALHPAPPCIFEVFEIPLKVISSNKLLCYGRNIKYKPLGLYYHIAAFLSAYLFL